MKNLAIAMIYVAFFGLIGFSIWMTGSLIPLWALLLTPSMKQGSDSVR